MTAFVQFALPLPPSINAQYATVNGRRVLSRDARRWKAEATQQLRHLALPTAFTHTLQTGYLALFIDVYFATPMRRDLDGGLKITQDTICDVLNIDDRRVVDIHLVKRIDPLNPRMEIELEALTDWQFDAERRVL